MRLFKLMREDKVFTVFYIGGTSIAVASAMVVAILWHILTGNIAQEDKRDQTVYIEKCTVTVPNRARTEFGFSKIFIEDFLGSLQSIKTATGYAKWDGEGMHYSDDPNGDQRLWPSTTTIVTDRNFFKIFNFNFIAGGPFIGDISKDHQAVISEKLARELYGSADNAIGKALYIQYLPTSRVSGVVSTPSSLAPDSYAHIYASAYQLAYGTSKNSSGIEYCGVMSNVRALPVDGYSIQDVCQEFNTAYGNYIKRKSKELNTKIEYEVNCGSFLAHKFIIPVDADDAIIPLSLMMLILLALPAFNLGGFVSNRMVSRLPEIGIRKAFGANHLNIFGMIFLENFEMTICGGLLGYPIAVTFVYLMADSDLSQFIIKSNIGSVDYNGVLSANMFISPELLATAIACCFILNILAAFIPSLKILTNPIVDALNTKR